MNNELGKILNERYSGICLEGLWKVAKSLSPGRDENLGFSKYEAVVLITRPQQLPDRLISHRRCHTKCQRLNEK
jgi:hypothetical protein